MAMTFRLDNFFTIPLPLFFVFLRDLRVFVMRTNLL